MVSSSAPSLPGSLLLSSIRIDRSSFSRGPKEWSCSESLVSWTGSPSTGVPDISRLSLQLSSSPRARKLSFLWIPGVSRTGGLETDSARPSLYGISTMSISLTVGSSAVAFSTSVCDWSSPSQGWAIPTALSPSNPDTEYAGWASDPCVITAPVLTACSTGSLPEISSSCPLSLSWICSSGRLLAGTGWPLEFSLSLPPLRSPVLTSVLSSWPFTVRCCRPWAFIFSSSSRKSSTPIRVKSDGSNPVAAWATCPLPDLAQGSGALKCTKVYSPSSGGSLGMSLADWSLSGSNRDMSSSRAGWRWRSDLVRCSAAAAARLGLWPRTVILISSLAVPGSVLLPSGPGISLDTVGSSGRPAVTSDGWLSGSLPRSLLLSSVSGRCEAMSSLAANSLVEESSWYWSSVVLVASSPA